MLQKKKKKTKQQQQIIIIIIIIVLYMNIPASVEVLTATQKSCRGAGS
jgi:hypothetical protein